jgi:hypothetical protein
MSHFQENLNQVLDLSQRIINLAQASDWTQVEQLDRQRKQILETLFNDQEFQANIEQYQQQVQDILALNDQALTCCSNTRKSMVKKGRHLKLGREAIAAYHKQSYD